MKSSTVSLESIKLQLIQNRQFVEHPENELQLSKEAIKYLIKALEYADASFTQEIENVLTKSGEVAIPALIKGLSSANMNVKSTSAMVLIRLGNLAVEPVKQFYYRNAHKSHLVWVSEFILNELCETYTRVGALEEGLSDLPMSVRTLEKVG